MLDVVGMVTVAVPDITTLVGAIVVPLMPELTDSDTVPLKPPMAWMVTVEVPVLPCTMVMGLTAVIVKSWTLTVTIAV